MKNLIKNRFLQIILFFLFLFVSIILFKKFNKYYSQNDFTKISLLIILLLSFFIGSLNKKLAKLNLIFVTYLTITLYGINSFLVFYEYNNSQKKNVERILKGSQKNYDKRRLLQVVYDERNQGKEIYPYVVPREFLQKKLTTNLPLTPMPNTEYVSCNEFGSWKKIKTDKLGFNNKIFLNTFDILLMGDSFAQGSCVDQKHEPTNLFKKNINQIAYSIGVSGNGPLLSLALAHEVKKILDFKYIIWFIYDNDFYDIKLELKSPYLMKYLEKDFVNHRYFSNTKKTNLFQKKYIKENLKKFKKHSFKEDLFELKPLIYRANIIIDKNKAKNNNDNNQATLKKVFDKLNHLYPNKKIYVVYLPETSCFQYRLDECEERFLNLKKLSKNFIFLNFLDFIKNKKIDYKKMYAFGQDRSHFSPEGYNLLINFISDEANFVD